MRIGNRLNDQLRETKIIPHFLDHNKASVLISSGKTKVLCAANVEDRVPHFLLDSNQGWLTAEYSMLPSSTPERNNRERYRVGGRTKEIQRLIGRSLRSVTNLEKLGQRTITIDCDVLQADGGTRTASITGAFVALSILIKDLLDNNKIEENPLTGSCAAISIGIFKGQAILDLCYQEDSNADVDMNIVMNDKGEFIEIQGTAEENTFTMKQLTEMLELANKGIRRLIQIQNLALEEFYG
ncbi:MAG: ribonuclease PH [Clostridia bacterium]